MRKWSYGIMTAMIIFVSTLITGGTVEAAKVIKSGGAEFSTYINSSSFQAPSGNLKLRAKTNGPNWYAKLCRTNGNCNVTNAIGPYKNGTFTGTFRNVPKGKYYLHFYKKHDGKWTKMSYSLFK